MLENTFIMLQVILIGGAIFGALFAFVNYKNKINNFLFVLIVQLLILIFLNRFFEYYFVNEFLLIGEIIHLAMIFTMIVLTAYLLQYFLSQSSQDLINVKKKHLYYDAVSKNEFMGIAIIDMEKQSTIQCNSKYKSIFLNDIKHIDYPEILSQYYNNKKHQIIYTLENGKVLNLKVHIEKITEKSLLMMVVDETDIENERRTLIDTRESVENYYKDRDFNLVSTIDYLFNNNSAEYIVYDLRNDKYHMNDTFLKQLSIKDDVSIEFKDLINRDKWEKCVVKMKLTDLRDDYFLDRSFPVKQIPNISFTISKVLRNNRGHIEFCFLKLSEIIRIKNQNETIIATRLINMVDQGVLLINQNGDIEYANKGITKMLRYQSSAELLGKNISEINDDMNLNKLKINMENMQKTDILHANRVYVTQYGTKLNVKIKMLPLNKFKDGKAIILITPNKADSEENTNQLTIDYEKLNKELHLGIANFIIYPDNKIEYFDSWYQLLKLSHNEMWSYNDFFDRILSKDRKEVKQVIKKCFDEKMHQEYNFTILNNNNELMTLHAYFYVIEKFFDGQSHLELTVVCKDITGRIKLQEKYKQNYYLLLESEKLGGMAHFRYDVKDNVFVLSESIKKIIDTVSYNQNVEYHDFLEYVHPEDRMFFDRKFNQFIWEQGKFDLIVRSASNNEQKYIHAIGKVYYDREGYPLYVIGNLADITQVKYNEQQLVSSKNILQSIIDQSPIGIMVVEENYIITQINSKLESMFNINEVNNKTLDALSKNIKIVQREYQSSDVCYQLPVYRTIETGEELSVVDQVLTGLGEKKWFQFNSSPLLNDEQKITGAIMTCIDLTSSKKIEKELNEKTSALLSSENQKSMIMNNVSDEIIFYNNKLEVLYFNNKYAQRKKISLNEVQGKKCFNCLPDNESQCKYCAVVKTLEQNQIIYSEEAIGDEIYEIQTFPVNNQNDELEGIIEVKKNVTKNRKDQLEKEYIRLRNLSNQMSQQYNGRLMAIMGFAELLLDAKEDAEKIKVYSKIIHETAKEISVLNEEILSDQKKILNEKFYQSVNGYNELKHLPREKPAYNLEKTVLIIDDELLIRELLTRVLENMGYKVLTASSGEEGIELYKENLSDLIILDLFMPGMDGPEVYDKLKSLDMDTKIIILSAYDMSQTLKIQLDGAVGFLQKPISIEEIKKEISKHLK